LFIEKYPSFCLINDAKTKHHFYLEAYLHGLSNTPAFEEDGSFKPELQKSYEYTIVNYPETKTAKIIKAHYASLTLTNSKWSETAVDSLRPN
jgi:hypothetical protein